MIYGQLLFYSERNICDWETSRSFGYAIMFLILTFGMLLIFKWVLKIMELIFLVFKKF